MVGSRMGRPIREPTIQYCLYIAPESGKWSKYIYKIISPLCETLYWKLQYPVSWHSCKQNLKRNLFNFCVLTCYTYKNWEHFLNNKVWTDPTEKYTRFSSCKCLVFLPIFSRGTQELFSITFIFQKIYIQIPICVTWASFCKDGPQKWLPWDMST